MATPTTALTRIVQYCARTLRINEVSDYAGAVNGLQVQNDGRVRRIAAAVDATLSTIELAASAGAELLLVHHGLFWTPRTPWTGPSYLLFRRLVEANLAVYSAHLPLDIHPRLGNNVKLCAALGLRRTTPFFHEKGQLLGRMAVAQLPLTALARRLQRAVGTVPLVIPGGPKLCRRIGVVTGGAGGELTKAAAEGVDTFITGEGPHWTYGLAEELGVNVLYGGHYATETFGVKALATDLSRKFRVPWSFLDYPTGL
jgi:dinuclear metal center YbgI/SA1388 family protein